MQQTFEECTELDADADHVLLDPLRDDMSTIHGGHRASPGGKRAHRGTPLQSELDLRTVSAFHYCNI
jgi:hypothetical protein